MSPITVLDYPLDKYTLIEDSKQALIFANAHTDSRYPNLSFNYWKISRYSSDYIDKIISDFDIAGRPRFYWLEPHTVIPEHTDNETKCSINFILSDNPAPITINNNEYYYKQALLDTTIPHSVKNGSELRLMLKISIFNETYQSLSERIKFKYES